MFSVGGGKMFNSTNINFSRVMRIAAIIVLLLLSPDAYSQTAIQFDGTNDYVTFGQATSTLGAQSFTVECWFQRTGAGVGTSTGTGGFTGTTFVPILTKGRGEAEGNNVDMNYALGIRNTDNVLVADFEEDNLSATSGLNHPIIGITVLQNNVWYHAAVTYNLSDGYLRLYLNGNIESSVLVGTNRWPEYQSLQHAALGTGLTSTGVAAGYFAGRIDEARIWNRALTLSEIRSGMSQEISSGSGLIGRWGLNNGSGTSATNSIAGSPNGTLTNGPTWVTGQTFPNEPWALQLNGTSNFVNFGSAPGLATQTYTVETWFKRTGTGAAVSTGTNGITMIPLVAKGAPETDGSAVDANYILGIYSATNVIAADFEEGTGSESPGLNHPLTGTTVLQNDVWYHAAVTFDSNGEYRLYLNGLLEASQSLGTTIWPQGNTTQHSALGTMLKSDGTNTSPSGGYFAGVLDEVHIWNYARTENEIQSNINLEITTPQANLLACWSLDEGFGTTVQGSAGTTVNGSIQSTGYSWVFGAPFNLSFVAPEAPGSLVATAGNGNQISLSWADNSNNEQGFAIERSIVGESGPFVPLTTVAANTTTFVDANLLLNTTFYYRVRAYRSSLVSDYSNTANATTPAEANNAIRFEGVDSYIKVTDGGGLALENFTLETWFKKDGNGISVTSGTGGIPDAIPLITKGTSESESSNLDINYFLCIKAATNVIAADFEEGAGGTSVSLNHPVLGVTPIVNNVWHHAAVTYDGTTLRLYLDGNLENSLVVGQPVASATTCNLAIGSSLRSTDVAQGFFDGTMDEIRIWNYARTQNEIQSTINSKIDISQTGLLARWRLDEGSGTSANGSAGTTFNGVVTNLNYEWVSGAPFNASIFPFVPTLIYPANGQADLDQYPQLEVVASDNSSTNLTVKFYGRLVEPNQKFTLIGFPDTQYYTSLKNGGSAAILNSQTQWVVNNKDALNIVYAVGLGDCVDEGDLFEAPWQVLDNAMDMIENPVTTNLPDGLPYGLAVGNHDQTANGDADGTTNFYNQYFGTNRFSGRGYYGGNYGSNNDNHFDLFSANGMDFIVIHFEYDTTPDAAVITWAENLLQTYSSRRAIIVSHWIINTGNPGSFSAQGQALYNAFRDNPNVFLMLSGHVPGEGRRTDTYEGNTIHSVLSDYQSRTNGGNGWLRIMEFDPSANMINVKTYSPYLNQFEEDGDSQFSLPYTMSGIGDAPFVELGSVTVPNNSNATYTWNGLLGGETYQWYVTITNENNLTTTGPIWSFSTDQNLPVEMTSFSANIVDEKVVLNWQTKTETNNYGFEVERSVVMQTSKSGWEKIGFVTGNGNSNSPKDYSFIDVNPKGGSSFEYRLKQIDNDGQYHYSDVVEVTVIPLEFALYQNYPNPFNPNTKIKYSIPTEADVTIKLYDILGKEIKSLVSSKHSAGNYEVDFNAANLASGTYFYRIQAKDFTDTKKLLIIK